MKAEHTKHAKAAAKAKLASVVVFVLIAVVFALSLLLRPIGSISAYSTPDAGVDNSASFATDTIYQIVTDRFFDGDASNNPTGAIFDKNNNRKYHGGDWAGISQKLDANYFTNMGISALWISAPVENINSLDPSNNSAAYHGYWGKDFFRTNPYFGSIAEFSSMIAKAHAKGIKVVIDFAPNHTSTAEYGAMVFPEDGRLYRDGALVGGFTNDTKGLFNHESWTDFSTWENSIYHSMYGLADLNHQNNEVDKYMKDSIRKWLDLGIDGIRVDAVKHMAPGWQKNWVSSIYDYKPVFVFGEWFAGGTGSDPEMEDFANTSGMSLLDFRFANAVRNSFGSLSGTMQDLNATILGTAADYKQVNNQVTFIDNHDMSRFTSLANNNTRSVDNAYVTMLTSRGVPTIYYGSEQYATGVSDPDNRGDMPGFSTTTNAYKVISKLAPLRKTNPALAYGTYQQRWMNNDVLVFERKFGSSVTLTAVNRNQATGYNLTGLISSLPQGTYSDVLTGILGGKNLSVSATGASTYTLGAGESAVWQYSATAENTPTIGNVDSLMGKAGNIVTVSGRGFGAQTGTVKFGTVAATVVSWSDSLIKAKVPAVAAGLYSVTVANSAGLSSYAFPGYEVLTASQVSVRFKINNASTALGQNVYILGNVSELGGWDASKAIGPFFNATSTIGTYPTWFYDISVPAGTKLEFKFIKKNAAGVVVWEGGNNRVYTTGTTTGEFVGNWQA